MNISFQAGGALTQKHDALYIKRQADLDAIVQLDLRNFILVIEPRQQGKTSLVNYLMRHPVLTHTQFAYIDVSTLDRKSESSWYASLYPRLLQPLRESIEQDKNPRIPTDGTSWRNFLADIATSTSKINKQLTFILDEIGSVKFDGTRNFFGAIRDIYNSRQAEEYFEQITFLLAGAFDPRDLIPDESISPFNIAQEIRLPDFSLPQVQKIVANGKWISEIADSLANRIHYWTDGQKIKGKEKKKMNTEKKE